MKALVASVLACVVLASAGVQAADSAADSAADVLAQSRAAYAALSSYADVGVVESSDTWDMPFTTAFVRPDRLRFASTSRHPFVLLYFVKTYETVVSDGQRSILRTEHDGEIVDRDMATLADAVASGTGVSSRAIHHMATLLKPDLWTDTSFGGSVLALRDARLVGTDLVDGVRCDHVAGREGTRKLDLWIGADDHFVRRIDTDFGSFRHSEFHRDIRIDVAIPSATFALAQGQ